MISEEENITKEPRPKKPLIDRILVVMCWVAALTCAPLVFRAAKLCVRALLCDQFITPTNSMEPTLLLGDRILVDKTIMGARIYKDFHFVKSGQDLLSWRTRGMRSVAHNDIIVFNFPYQNDSVRFVINYVYAKRCIALPGDSLSVVCGYYRNNNFDGEELGYLPMQEVLTTVPEDAFDYWAFHIPPHDGHHSNTLRDMQTVYVPRRGDVVRLGAREGSLYRILLQWETGKTITFDWETNQVLADGKHYPRHIFQNNYYFAAGDNVLNSSDSRYWGLVPEDYIIGVTNRISYSLDKQRDKYRTDRIMMNLERE